MIQDIYNHLGIIHCNRENQKKGLPYFAKAEQIYELVKGLKVPNLEINNNLKNFLRDCKGGSKNSTTSDAYGFNSKSFPQLLILGHSSHSFYINGGIDKVKVERNYTLTIFYLAQVYAKLEKNEKAVNY